MKNEVNLDPALRRALVWFSIGVLVVIATLATAKAMRGADLCNDVGWYQRSGDLIWSWDEGQYPGRCQQGGTGAHTYSCYGEHGYYQILDQCPREARCTGTTGTWKRPDDPIAGPIWDCFYTTACPNSEDIPQQPEVRRRLFGYYNDAFRIPTGAQHYDFFRLAQIPNPPRDTIARAHGCQNVTPQPTVPRSSTPVRTPTRRPTTTLPPIPGGCPGGVPCTKPPTPTAVPPTKIPTSTMVPPTHAPDPTAPPARTATARQTSIPSATPSTTGSPTPTFTPAPSCWFCGCKSK